MYTNFIVLFFLVISLLVSFNEAATVYKQLYISWFNAAPDGFTRRVMGFNHQFPGPPITVNVGDKLVVNVTNLSGTPTTVHFHGIFQNNSFEMDGVPSVTQCLIPSGNSFIYQFYLVGQWGTFWYHSHFSGQIVDGMRGAFIVKNSQAQLPGISYTTEHIVQLSDWYHNRSETLIASYTAPNGNGNEPVPDSILINIDPSTSNNTLLITPNTKTRLRIINQSAFAVITFYIEGHPLTVIEVDGNDVSPKVVNAVRLNVAQRYSVVVLADAAIGIYRMHAIFDQDVFPSPAPHPETVAYFAYVGATRVITPEPENSTVLLSGYPSILNATVMESPINLKPYPPKKVPCATRQIPLTLAIFPNSENVTTAHFNDISFHGPMNTTLTQLVRASQPFPPISHVISINTMDVVDFVIFNNDTGEHPIHIHGHRFLVLGMGEPNAGLWDAGRDDLQLSNPLQRDTASVNPGSWLYLRLLANNPGLWMFHCHISWHASIGLGLVLSVGADQVRSRLGTVETPVMCFVENTVETD